MRYYVRVDYVDFELGCGRRAACARDSAGVGTGRQLQPVDRLKVAGRPLDECHHGHVLLRLDLFDRLVTRHNHAIECAGLPPRPVKPDEWVGDAAAGCGDLARVFLGSSSADAAKTDPIVAS